MNKLIDCDVDKNLSALIISGFPSEDQLTISWALIQTEFADGIGSNEHRAYLNLLAEIVNLRKKIAIINDMIALLREAWYAGFAKILNKELHTSFVFDHANPQEYKALLDRCKRRTAGLELNLDLKELRFEEIKQKNEVPGKGRSREYYHNHFINLSDHARFPVLDTISGYEFVTRLKRFNEYCEALEKKANG